MTATVEGARAPSDVCPELKILAIGALGLMAGGPEDHFTDSRERYVVVEGDAWADVEGLDMHVERDVARSRATAFPAKQS